MMRSITWKSGEPHSFKKHCSARACTATCSPTAAASGSAATSGANIRRVASPPSPTGAKTPPPPATAAPAADSAAGAPENPTYTVPPSSPCTSPDAAASAAAQRSQARASSGEEASSAPRTWLVSNLHKHEAFELLRPSNFHLSFFFLPNWARKVEKGTNFLRATDAAGIYKWCCVEKRWKFGAEELTWKLLLLQRRRPWLPADELPRSGGGERKRETWMEA